MEHFSARVFSCSWGLASDSAFLLHSRKENCWAPAQTREKNYPCSPGRCGWLRSRAVNVAVIKKFIPSPGALWHGCCSSWRSHCEIWDLGDWAEPMGLKSPGLAGAELIPSTPSQPEAAASCEWGAAFISHSLELLLRAGPLSWVTVDCVHYTAAMLLYVLLSKLAWNHEKSSLRPQQGLPCSAGTPAIALLQLKSCAGSQDCSANTYTLKIEDNAHL